MKKAWMRAGIALSAILLMIAGGMLFARMRQPQEDIYKYADCDAVYFTMGHSPVFSETDFLTYRGLKTIKAEEHPTSIEQISVLLNTVFKDNPNVDTIYMELDPGALWENADADSKKWKSQLKENLMETIKRNSGTTFEILLSYPMITYWTGMEEERRAAHLQAYQSFVSHLAEQENVLIFYVGAQQWLNTNTDNYKETFRANAEVEKHIFLSTFCDRAYLTDAGKMEQELEKLRQQIREYPAKALEYPNFSEWSFVFFGDSIIGLDKNTTSIPGVVGSLSDARVYNCGKSGALAAKSDSEIPCFLDVLNYFLDGEVGKITDEELKESMDLFLESDYSQEKLCFFLNFGLNDYFQGCAPDNPLNPHDPESYAGALRLGITELKDTYPEAKIVLLVPTYIRTYKEGTWIQGEKGELLSAYREVAAKVAEEMGVYCKDNFQELGINGSNYLEYLSDECHLNTDGRFLFGEQLVFFLKEQVIE